MFNGKFPSITAGQATAFATWVVSQAIAWGWVSNDQGQILLSAGATVLAAAWKIADAFLRANRAKAYAQNPAAFDKG